MRVARRHPHSQAGTPAGTPALRLTLLIALGTKLASIRTTLFCAIAARLGSSFLAERCGKAQPQHVGKRRRDGRIRKPPCLPTCCDWSSEDTVTLRFGRKPGCNQSVPDRGESGCLVW